MAAPFRSAMSVLVFYINRAGGNLGVSWNRPGRNCGGCMAGKVGAGKSW